MTTRVCCSTRLPIQRSRLPTSSRPSIQLQIALVCPPRCSATTPRSSPPNPAAARSSLNWSSSAGASSTSTLRLITPRPAARSNAFIRRSSVSSTSNCLLALLPSSSFSSTLSPTTTTNAAPIVPSAGRPPWPSSTCASRPNLHSNQRHLTTEFAGTKSTRAAKSPCATWASSVTSRSAPFPRTGDCVYSLPVLTCSSSPTTAS